MIFVGISNFKNGTEKCQRTVPRFSIMVRISCQYLFRKFETICKIEIIFAKFKSFSKIRNYCIRKIEIIFENTSLKTRAKHISKQCPLPHHRRLFPKRNG